jgi:hypothetical protein
MLIEGKAGHCSEYPPNCTRFHQALNEATEVKMARVSGCIGKGQMKAGDLGLFIGQTISIFI